MRVNRLNDLIKKENNNNVNFIGNEELRIRYASERFLLRVQKVSIKKISY